MRLAVTTHGITLMAAETFDGACTCGAIRYRLVSAPMIVHCCHCSWCQRETGSAFVVNAMIETDRLALLQGEPNMVDTPSARGKSQPIDRREPCHCALCDLIGQEGGRESGGQCV